MAIATVEQRRRDAGGRIALSEGVTCWRREGTPDGIPIVLVHGATVPAWEFDFLVPPLLRAGFQTLRFDLYAHGTSDRPAGDYTFERFTRQVIEIIEATDFPRPAFLLGHSFGAALVAAVAAARPDLVSKLVLVAPMLDFSSTSTWTRLFRLPVVGEIAMHGVGVPALIRRRRRRYAGIGKPQLTPRFIEQCSDRGFGRGLLSMFRSGALGEQSPRYAALRGFAGALLVITGDHDAIIPPQHVARVRELLPPHLHCRIDAEHNLLLTHPDAVVDALIRWKT
jgi:pimeloyl-ACP methyl ester carboxylesterase